MLLVSFLFSVSDLLSSAFAQLFSTMLFFQPVLILSQAILLFVYILLICLVWTLLFLYFWKFIFVMISVSGKKLVKSIYDFMNFRCCIWFQKKMNQKRVKFTHLYFILLKSTLTLWNPSIFIFFNSGILGNLSKPK